MVTSQLCYTQPHGDKETKLSHLNSQESFRVFLNFAARENVESDEVHKQIKDF